MEFCNSCLSFPLRDVVSSRGNMKPRNEIFIVICFLIFVFGGGYIFLFGNPVPKPDMSNLKRYDEYGLKFEYPKNWDILLANDTKSGFELNLTN